MPRALLDLAARVAGRTRGTQTQVLVNDRADVALSVRGAGVHLKSDGPPVSAVRALARADRLIGRSAHDPVDTRLVDGADYLVFGTVFPPDRNPGVQAAGVDALRRACAAVTVPVLAIGGVTPDVSRTAGARGPPASLRSESFCHPAGRRARSARVRPQWRLEIHGLM